MGGCSNFLNPSLRGGKSGTGFLVRENRQVRRSDGDESEIETALDDRQANVDDRLLDFSFRCPDKF